MTSIRLTAAVTIASLLQIGCNVADQPTAPKSVEASTSRFANGATVELLDQCEPTSFNAVLGAGACVGTGTVTFDEFITELTRHRRVNVWQMEPRSLNMTVGQILAAINLGGETHTFTEVDEFGGGIVQNLNELAGVPVPAPECLTLDQEDFLAPGAS